MYPLRIRSRLISDSYELSSWVKVVLGVKIFGIFFPWETKRLFIYNSSNLTYVRFDYIEQWKA